MPTATAPVAETERVQFWDVLRGVAVLGILLVNIPYMAMSGALTTMSVAYPGGDRWVDHAVMHLVLFTAETKFITIFSLLFGVGLAQMAERATRHRTPFAPLYRRRLLVLLGFGVLHGTLLWFGDILTLYAVLGFVGMWLRHCALATLLRWAGVLLALNWMMWVGFGFLDPLDLVPPREVDGVMFTSKETLELDRRFYADVFASGDFAAMLEARAEIYGIGQLEMLLFVGLRTVALFMLGIAAVKSGLFLSIEAHRAVFRRLVWVGLTVGVALQIACNIAVLESDTPRRVVAWVALYPAGLLLAAGYVGVVALWSSSPILCGVRGRLAAVGRMALTNYITHSVATAVLFNYCGLFDRYGRPELLAVVVGLFVLQLWLSPLWLRAFRMGPLEWVWRSLTYGGGVVLRRR